MGSYQRTIYFLKNHIYRGGYLFNFSEPYRQGWIFGQSSKQGWIFGQLFKEPYTRLDIWTNFKRTPWIGYFFRAADGLLYNICVAPFEELEITEIPLERCKILHRDLFCGRWLRNMLKWFTCKSSSGNFLPPSFMFNLKLIER